jgi:hypothetical protein
MFFRVWLRKRNTARNRRRFQPQLEALEVRTLPSTFRVVNLADSGPGSLRQAILDANANPGADLVKFDAALTGTISLASELNVTDALTIDGPGQQKIAVSGNNATREFDISVAGIDVTIAELTIANGRAEEGAGVWNGGNLTISNSVLLSNQAAGDIGRGGGVFNAAGAVLTIDHSMLTGNLATGSDRGLGGGLLNDGQAFVSHTTFADNNAIGGTAGNFISSSGRGGAIRNENGAYLTVDHSTFVNNQAVGGAGIAGAGGAIYNDQASADVNHSTFTGNQAIGGDSNGGAPAGFGIGGSIINSSDTNASILTISDCTFVNNQAFGGNGGAGSRGGNGVGGALFNNQNDVPRATITVEHSVFTDNLAQGGQRGVAGGGILNGNGLGGAIGNGFGASLIVSNSQLSSNEAVGGNGLDGVSGGDGLGGGIVNLFDASATVMQSQLIDNLALGGTGGVGANGGNGQGGGIFNGFSDVAASVVTLLGAHVTDNQAVGGTAGTGGVAGLGQGGGLYNQSGAFAFVDALTKFKNNKASTSDDDIYGLVTPI